MSDTAIFAIGLLTALLFAGGLVFTFLEIRRIEREHDAPNTLNQPHPPTR